MKCTTMLKNEAFMSNQRFKKGIFLKKYSTTFFESLILINGSFLKESYISYGKRQKSCTLIVIWVKCLYLTSPTFNSSAKSSFFYCKGGSSRQCVTMKVEKGASIPFLLSHNEKLCLQKLLLRKKLFFLIYIFTYRLFNSSWMWDVKNALSWLYVAKAACLEKVVVVHLEVNLVYTLLLTQLLNQSKSLPLFFLAAQVVIVEW